MESYTNAYIDLNSLRHNYKIVSDYIGKTCCVVKSDAYGHGARRSAQALYECGADFFVVSDISEAFEILPVVGQSQILILGATDPRYAALIQENRFVQTVFSLQQARELASRGFEIDAHVKLDSGMNRLGFSCDEEGIREIKLLSEIKEINVKGLFTHYACASDDALSVRRQYDSFTEINKEVSAFFKNKLICHSASSAAALLYPYTHMDMCRVGLILYGMLPCSGFHRMGLVPVMELRTKVMSVHKAKKGSGVSYGWDCVCPRDTYLAVLPIGYANGFLRRYRKFCYPEINGRNVRVVGRVCMDRCMIDVTDLILNGVDVRVGDEVTMFGRHCGADIIAKGAATINYEIATVAGRLNNRIYTG